jgi:hypothetical protein
VKVKLFFVTLAQLNKSYYLCLLKRLWSSGALRLKRHNFEENFPKWKDDGPNSNGLALLLNSVDRRFLYPDFPAKARQGLEANQIPVELSGKS